MNGAHLAVVNFVCHGGAACADHSAIEITVVHAQHHATYILIVLLALPLAGIGALVNKGLQDISPPPP